MTVSLTYEILGTVEPAITLEHVAEIRLVSKTEVDIRCFGNDWVRHRNVYTLVVLYNANN